MGGNTSKTIKRWISGEQNHNCGFAINENIIKGASPFIYKRSGSMYFDQDGDLAHEFYEEIPATKRGTKNKMKKIVHGLTPQGDVKLRYPRLHTELPVVLYED